MNIHHTAHIRYFIYPLVIISLLVGGVLQVNSTAAEPQSYNYVEALQKSLYFYDAQKSGPGIAGGRLQWRGDSEIEDQYIPFEQTNLSPALVEQYRTIFDPDGDGAVDVSGGFHDAGDHVKFGLPQSYSASTLGWSYYEFKDAFIENGLDEHMLDILKWFSDYFLRSTFRDASGNVIAFNYMVGEGSVDHNYWGPPELQEVEKYPRPATFATRESLAADQTAGAAAALALMSLNYRDIDPDYADDCLETAIALYEFAREDPSALGTGDGFYNSSYAEDELSWAAIWLYVATNDISYIRHIDSTSAGGQYTGYMKQIIATTENTWQNIWVHSWDTVWGGVFAKLASLFPENEQFDYFARWNLEYWSGGAIPHEDPSDTSYLSKSPAGFAVINTWGSARYNSTAQFQALVYAKYTGRMDFIEDWAKGQMDYIMGDNPFGYSLIVGFGDEHCSYPHHRAAHGSKSNSMLDPVEHKHTLWGALCGGPDINDVHEDVTTDYVYNEVAIDYNAGLVGALAGYTHFYGQNQDPLPDFPPQEPAIDPYFVEVKLEQESNERTQMTIKLHNESIHPPAFETGMSARYYINISELLAAGQSIDNVSFQVMYDEQKTGYGGAVAVTGPVVWDAANGIYYYEFDWSGYNIYGDRDFHFALVVEQDGNWNGNWDASNDWGRQGIPDDDAFHRSQYIPVYLDGTIVHGEEPGVSPTPTPAPPTPTPAPGDPTPTPPPADEACAIDYSIREEWGNGFTTDVTIHNTGTIAINGWLLTWTFPNNQSISSLWNAEFSQDGANVEVQDSGWNGTISPGNSVSFGFQGSHNGINTIPTTFVINGVVCQ